MVAIRILFWDTWVGLDLEALLGEAELGSAWTRLETLAQAGMLTGKAVFWIVIPILCWTICYFRLRETQR